MSQRCCQTVLDHLEQAFSEDSDSSLDPVPDKISNLSLDSSLDPSLFLNVDDDDDVVVVDADFNLSSLPEEVPFPR